MLGILSIILLSIISCNSDESEGKWDDNIKLSEKEIAINAESNSLLITTEGTSWWINEIGLNNDWNFDLSEIDTTQENFLINETEFTVERKNGNEIYIFMTENRTDSERTLSIGLQAGNYFDSIRIIQSKD
jgi:hypothetical protein